MKKFGPNQYNEAQPLGADCRDLAKFLFFISPDYEEPIGLENKLELPRPIELNHK